MKINFFSHRTFEDWYWETPFTTGIGGSEVSHIEMSERLALEHDVTSYAPIPGDKRGLKETVAKWKHWSECKFEEEGIWIIYRTIAVLDVFNKRPDQKIWIVMQDTHIVEDWTKERTDKIDRIITLCEDHAKFVAECHPEVKDKIVISSNGVRSDLIEEIAKKGIVRDPKSLIWASSPDRGMDTMIKIFKRAYEWDNELRLHIYYGFNNLDKGRQTSRVLALKKCLEENRNHPGIQWHGRVDQMTLYEAWFKSGIWCYPTLFSETSCISCIDAQSCGAIPITNPLWALKENVRHGIFIQGDVDDDALIQARYVDAIVSLANNPELQESIRERMMPHIRSIYDWDRWCDEWVEMAEEDLLGAHYEVSR